MEFIQRTLNTKPRHEEGETVYATNLGWCIRQAFKPQEEECIYEYRNLLDILTENGYDMYGVEIVPEAGEDTDGRSDTPTDEGDAGTEPETDSVDDDTTDETRVDDNDNSDGDDIESDNGGTVDGTSESDEGTDDTEVEVQTDGSATDTDSPTRVTRESLEALPSLKEVRAVGAKFDVNDISKAKLIDKILEAQDAKVV
ncbi:hypothetical protein VPHK469_0192 [Vibrio phage K469]